jgi:DNA ligase-1
MKTLYSKDSSNRIRIWEIKVEGDTYFTRDYINDGKIKEWVGVKCIAKNLQKINETTAEQQAEIEAENKYQEKLRDNYFVTETEALNNKEFRKMLAQPLEKYAKNLSFPYYMDYKYDGVACNVITKDGVSVLNSRNGKEFVSIPHILEALHSCGFLSDWPHLILCGELYNHELKDNFNHLISLVRKTKPTAEDLIESRVMKYYVYDYYDPMNPDLTYTERRDNLRVWDSLYFQNTPIKHVATFLAENQEQADRFHSQALNEGFEGSMIRTPEGLYEPDKRSSQLLKRKDFDTEEYELVDVLEGNGAWQGKAKAVVVKLNGGTCEAGLRGNFTYTENLLKNKASVIGKMATIRYFGFTPDGEFRFPVMLGIRDYE